MDSGSNVVLFITHFWDDACTAQIAKLRRELGGRYDIRVAGYIGDGMPHPAVPDDVPTHFYSTEQLTLVQPDAEPGTWWPQFVVPRFFMDFPDYGHYWMIEYDVRYTGDWWTLFATLNDPDVAFYGIALQRRAENPIWTHWPSFYAGADMVAPENQIKSFTPLQRLSATGLGVIQAAYRRGWRGHYEAVWPSAIAHAGLRLEEIGAKGAFTPKSRRGKHYTFTPHDPNGSPGSFVYRPTFAEHQIKPSPPRLWHPVKPADQQLPRMPWTAPPPGIARRILRRLSGGLISG